MGPGGLEPPTFSMSTKRSGHLSYEPLVILTIGIISPTLVGTIILMSLIKRAVIALFDFLQSIVVMLAVMVMIYLFVMSPQEIDGASMEPNFHDGEYILTNKIEYKLNVPQRGDVVIFKSPINPQRDYIKRIVALPGERIRLSHNTIYINDQPLHEPYIPENIYTVQGSYLKDNNEIVIPQDKYFVLGDNRQHSSDSREFGPIEKTEFIGKAYLRYWPFTRFGILPRPEYKQANVDSIGVRE